MRAPDSSVRVRILSGVIVADEQDAVQRHAAGAQGFDRQQGVIDSAEASVRAHSTTGRAPDLEQIDLQIIGRGDRHHQPAGAFDDQPAVDLRQGQVIEIDRHAIELGRTVRRQGRAKDIGFRQETIVRASRSGS